MSEVIMSEPILIEISPGELLDRISILEIKARRLGDEDRRAGVRRELDRLLALRAERIASSPQLEALAAELAEANAALWEIEDAIRLCESRGEFGPAFIELARSVYLTNDRRSSLKRRLDQLLGSTLQEAKLYAGGPSVEAKAADA